MLQELNQPSGKTGNKSRKGETITELAHRHLLDPNHTTTDEELSNAKFEFSDNASVADESLFEIDNTALLPPLPGETEAEDSREKSSSPPNPYDVLSS